MSDAMMIAVAFAMFGVVLILALVPGRIARTLTTRAELKRNTRKRR